jgi:blue copper oxidase
MTNITRRRVLKSAVAGSIAVGAATIYWPSSSFAGHVNIQPKPLIIPAQLHGREDRGVQVYDVTLQNGETEFFDGYQTRTSGINGSYLGPTLMMRNANPVRINVTNKLGESSTLHWHGMHLPAAQDGGPHQVIANNEMWSPEFTVKQKAASLWYHPHLMGKTGEHVWRGLAGMVIIEDEETDELDVPSDYGVDDIPLVLQDRWFTEDGQLDYKLSMHSKMMGMSGNIPLANGTVLAYFEASTTRLRIRLLNGSNASTYNLALSNGERFSQIATDGGLLESPVSLNLLRLSPGERAEIVVDLQAGKAVSLINIALSQGDMMSGENNNAPKFSFLDIRPQTTLVASEELPDQLTQIDWLKESDATATRTFSLENGMGMMSGGATINGKEMDIDRIDEVVKRGTTEIWQLRNPSRMTHPFHMHDVQFQILDRNGKPPFANENGRKDVVLVHPGEQVRIIMRFEDYADEETPYMYHCHILEHEDDGMMGQFLVV